MPGHTFRGSTHVTTANDILWSRLDDPLTWEGIPGVDRVYDPIRDQAGRLLAFKFDSTAMGKTYAGSAKPGPREDLRFLTWQIGTSEVSGRIEVKTEAVGEGTRVDVSLEVSPVSMMASLAFPIISGAIAGGFQESIERWAQQLEG